MRLPMACALALFVGVGIAAGAARATAVATVFEGVRANDVAAVAQTLDAGGAVDARDDAGMTPLLQASAAGRLELVRLLLARGAAAELRDAQQYDAMDYAIEHHHHRQVDLGTLAANLTALVNDTETLRKRLAQLAALPAVSEADLHARRQAASRAARERLGRT